MSAPCRTGAGGGTPQAVPLLCSAGSPHPRVHQGALGACTHTHASPCTHACRRRGEARHVQAGAGRAPKPHQRGGDAAADPGQRRGAGGRQPQQHQGEGPGPGGAAGLSGLGVSPKHCSVPQGVLRVLALGCLWCAQPCPGVSPQGWSLSQGAALAWRVPGGYQQGWSSPWGIPGVFVPIPSGSGASQVLILGQPRPPSDILQPLGATCNPLMTPCKCSGRPLCPWRHPHPPSAPCIVPGMFPSPR